MNKKILASLGIVITGMTLAACGTSQPTVNNEQVSQGFLEEVSIEDGEVREKEVNTGSSDTISVKPDTSFNLKETLTAMYGNGVEISHIVCNQGVSEINGNTVTCHSNSIIEFNMEKDGQTTHKTLKVLVKE